MSWRNRWRHVWNWLMGKRIVHTCRRRGRVMVRTGRNSSRRTTGGQWYIQSYERQAGPPPLPRCARGQLDDPLVELRVARYDGDALAAARRWYERAHGPLAASHELELVCVYDPDLPAEDGPRMAYRPNEVFEVEYPWLCDGYDGPRFTGYFGTWYGSGYLTPGEAMDFEIFWTIGSEARPLPPQGASW
jgi:hypothetical protein